MNNVEKRQTAFLNLEDYLYDILNMSTHYSGVFLSEHRTSRCNVCDAYCTNVTVRRNERKKAFGRSPPYQE